MALTVSINIQANSDGAQAAAKKAATELDRLGGAAERAGAATRAAGNESEQAWDATGAAAARAGVQTAAAGQAAAQGVHRVAAAAQHASAEVVAGAGRSAQAWQRMGATAEAAGFQAQAGMSAMLGGQMRLNEAQAEFLLRMRDQAATVNMSATELLRYRAAQLGVAGQADPLIAQLERQRAAMGGNALSAGELRQAMRYLPMQMTDVAVSLASGMPVWMVAIQQGGQLKDSFGGVGPALRATATYALGLVNPVTVAAAAVGVLALAAYQGAAEHEALVRAVELSGNAMGVTADSVAALAADAAQASGLTRGAVAEAAAQMVTAGGVAVDQLGAAAVAAVELERVGGAAVEKTAQRFAELGKDPLAASVKLNESFRFLTLSTYEQIKAASDMGDKQRAAQIAQDAYAQATIKVAADTREQLGTLSRMWLSVEEAAGKAWGAMKGTAAGAMAYGSNDDTLKRLRERLELGDELTDKEWQQYQALMAQVSAKQAAAQEDKKAKDAAAARAAWDQSMLSVAAQYLPKKERELALEREIASIRERGSKAQAPAAQIEAQVAQARAQAAQANQAQQAAASQAAAVASARIAAAEQQRQEAFKRTTLVLEAARATQQMTDEDYLAARLSVDLAALESQRQAVGEELALVQRRANSQQDQARLEGQAAQLKEQADTLRIKHETELLVLQDKRARAATEATAAVIESAQQETVQLLAQVKAQTEANEAIGLTGVALAGLAARRLQDAAAEKERRAKLADDVDARLAAEYRAQAAALRELAAARVSGAQQQQVADAAKTAADEWKRASDDINKSLTDALMRGFESGKDAAANLRDTVKSMFGSMVLRPMAQLIVTGALGAVGVAPAGAAQPSASSSAAQVAQYLGGGSFGGGLGAGLGAYGSEGGAAGAWDAAMVAMRSGNTAGGLGTMAGLGASTLGMALAAHQAGESVRDGYKVDGLPSWAGSVVHRAFGMRPKEAQGDAYLSGSVSADAASIAGRQDWRQKGGWFRSDRSGTDTFSNDTTRDVAGQLQAQVRETFDVMASGLGVLTGQALVSDAALDGFALDLAAAGRRFALTQEGIAEALGYTSDQVVMRLLPSVSVFQRSGETLTQTAQRLITTVGAVDAAQVRLGANTLALGAGMANAGAKQALVDLAGGAQAFSSAASTYYQAFYSGSEQAAGNAAALRAQFGQLNQAMPTSRAEFRALMEAQDLNTDAGRRMYAQLLALAGAFDAVQASADGYRALIAELGGAADGGAGVDLRATLEGNADAVATARAALEGMDAQLESLSESLRGAGVLDAARLQQQLHDATVRRYRAELALAQALYDKGKSALAAIASERAAVASAREQITPRAVMTLEQIRAGIAGVVGSTDLPSSAGVQDARAALTAADARAADWSNYAAGLDAVRNAASASAAALATAQAAEAERRTAYEAWYNDPANYKKMGYSSASIDLADPAATARDAAMGFLDNFIHNLETYHPADSERWGYSQLVALRSTTAAYYQAADAAAEAQAALAAYTAQASPAGTQEQAAAAQAAAQQALADAQRDYYAAMDAYVSDAAQGVESLKSLREETLRYYQAQAALAAQMSQSAAGLRSAVADARYSDMTPAAQLAQLQSQFSAALTGANGASGAQLAGYADQLAALVSPILEKAKEVAGVDYIALREQVLADADAIAARLETTLPTNYAAASLELLDQLDASLAAIAAQTATAQADVVAAINTSRDAVVDGLRALLLAVQGEAVPAFAAGGYHAGGLRLVGERGPELEATGAARIYSARETAALLRSAGGPEPAQPVGLSAARRPPALELAQLQLDQLGQLQRNSSQQLREQVQLVQAVDGVVAELRKLGAEIAQMLEVARSDGARELQQHGLAQLRALDDVRRAIADGLDQLDGTTRQQGRRVVSTLESAQPRRRRAG